jgi:hypothetical protein
MSDRYELINLQTMTGKLFIDGELVAEYKVETCDQVRQRCTARSVWLSKERP